jgi:hypothetical protein
MAKAKWLDAYRQIGEKGLRFAVCGLRFAVCGLRFAYFFITFKPVL